jgi:hypothetical protein
MGSHKHGTSGMKHNPHNRDMVQTNRELNKRKDEEVKVKKRQKGRMYESLRALMRDRRKP